MSSEYPEPYVRGVRATAKQAWSDLFVWKKRTIVTSENGEQYTELVDPDPFQNPIRLFARLRLLDWVYFLVGFSAWTADAFDFHAVSIQTVKMADWYSTTKTNISTAITLTLLLRSAGAAIFGILGDRYGRKWPMVFNLVVLGVLQIATIYSGSFKGFLAARALFGLFMGGVYGNAVAMALENCPQETRGLMSGILQQGYSFGYVLAAVVNLGVGGETESWPIMFWVGAGMSIGVGVIRVFFPESKQFRELRASGHKQPTASEFWMDLRKMLREEWKMSIYCIILMTWFNFFSHSSQDSYTTFLLVQKELSNSGASRASILMKTGACIGGGVIGYLSQFFGRRRAIIFSAFMASCLIPAWILPTEEGALSAAAFFIQFFVQGAWGIIPIHLNELSPPAFRSSFPGITYQIGNMISSPSAQIVNAVAEKVFITARRTGDRVQAYGPVMGVTTAIIALGMIATTAFGPELRGRDWGHAVAGVHDDGPQVLVSKGDEETVIEGKGTTVNKNKTEVTELNSKNETSV